MRRLFPALFGAFLGLALLKFGNPPIMEEFVTRPSNGWELVLNSPWPINWGYIALGLVVLTGLLAGRWSTGTPRSLSALPFFWLLWQYLASARSISEQLTNPTLRHFTACVACFYLGLFSLSGAQSLTGFWLGILCGFLLVVAFGWQQHFGGLEQTRQYFFNYIYPQAKGISPEYLKKISSNRIFSTLFYPNALAGALLLFLPGVLGFIWRARQRFTISARTFLAASVTVGALGSLYWSGSKGGWLLMLLLGLIALLRLPFQTRTRMSLVTCILLIGLGCFFAKYVGFFKKGATSVSARFDYWNAALHTAVQHPLFGTGPGTFARPYASIKRPESEMTRLAHNDYLEQASDSGWLGFIAYAAFLAGTVVYTGRYMFRFPLDKRPPRESSSLVLQSKNESKQKPSTMQRTEPELPHDPDLFPVWLGFLGWSLQGLFEFSLYIPALAWPAFAFAGLLLGKLPKYQNQSTKPRTATNLRPA